MHQEQYVLQYFWETFPIFEHSISCNKNILLWNKNPYYHPAYILPFLFNLYAKYTMGNAGLDETQTVIKVARRNINNLRYASDTTLMAVSKEELKSLLMKVKEGN